MVRGLQRASPKRLSCLLSRNRDDKLKKSPHTLGIAGATTGRFSPAWDEIAKRLQHWKKVALIFLRLPEDTGQTFFDERVIRRGLCFGLASALMLGALLPLFLQRSTTSPVFNLILFGVTSALALLSVCAMLVINLID